MKYPLLSCLVFAGVLFSKCDPAEDASSPESKNLIVEIGESKYTYDDHNRLVSFYDPGRPVNMSFTYNGNFITQTIIVGTVPSDTTINSYEVDSQSRVIKAWNNELPVDTSYFEYTTDGYLKKRYGSYSSLNFIYENGNASMVILMENNSNPNDTTFYSFDLTRTNPDNFNYIKKEFYFLEDGINYGKTNMNLVTKRISKNITDVYDYPSFSGENPTSIRSGVLYNDSVHYRGTMPIVYN